MNIYQQEIRERREWRLDTAIITLITIGLLSLALASCRPDEVRKFEKAKEKYATDVVDTTYQTIQVTVPRDSVIHVLKTDTTRVFERVRQGRATLTIIREPTNTTVIANCDSASQKQKVLVKTVTQKWGVDPQYERWMERWRGATIVLLFILVLAFLVGVFLYRFRGFTIQRPQPNGNA